MHINYALINQLHSHACSYVQYNNTYPNDKIDLEKDNDNDYKSWVIETIKKYFLEKIAFDLIP